MKKKSKFEYVFLAFVSLVMYLPIIVVVVFSFNNNLNTAIWKGFTTKWYSELFADRAMFEALRNSLFLATVSSTLAAVIGTLGAVGFSRRKSKVDGMIQTVSMIPIMVPEIILGIVFLLFFSLLGIPFGMTPLIIAHTAFCIPYVFSTVSSRLVGIDSAYVEAARDLGASDFRAFLGITFPLVWPGVISGMLMAFVMSFDDVIISSFLSGASSNTLPVKIYSQMKSSVKPSSFAMCALMFFVSIALVFLATVVKKIKSIHIKNSN